MRKLVLVVHNVRSAHNVGSLLRTAEGLGVDRVYLCGYSPYPAAVNDGRLLHIRRRVDKAINKTALGAQQSLDWQYIEDIKQCLQLLSKSFQIVALEQTTKAVDLAKFKPNAKALALVVGNEVEGLDEQTLDLIKYHVKIPMVGRKESFNVSIAAALALYHLKYLDKYAA